MTPDETYETPFDTDNNFEYEDVDTTSEDIDNTSELEAGDPDTEAEVAEAKQAWDDQQSDAVSDAEDDSTPSVAHQVNRIAEIAVDQSADDTVAAGHDEASDDDRQDDGPLSELAQPFVGQWNQLISTTNWEKGRIISQWRSALIESGVESSEYSDEAWARRVGGVTAPHVGRLRRVYDRFATSYESYAGLYWSHFLAALDWEDAPLWLEGAAQEKWSVAGMREKRWQSHGAVESQRPTGSQIIEVDTDEDVVLPAQGGGNSKEYGDEPGTASGPRYDDPDFGDEDELMSLAGSDDGSGGGAMPTPVAEADGEKPAGPIQPFAGLPELPDDLSDAIESIKLAVLRHKSAKWDKVDVETVQKYLDAVAVLLRS